ncbi:hypothetical protein H0H81_005756, partial [Sphagnurus paluster]
SLYGAVADSRPGRAADIHRGNTASEHQVPHCGAAAALCRPAHRPISNDVRGVRPLKPQGVHTAVEMSATVASQDEAGSWSTNLTFTLVPPHTADAAGSGHHAQTSSHTHAHSQPPASAPASTPHRSRWRSHSQHHHHHQQHTLSSQQQQLQPHTSTSHQPHTAATPHSHSHSHHHRHGKKSKKDKDKDRDSTHVPKPKFSSITRAIALASSTNVPTILPYAYYLLARTGDARRFLTHTPSPTSTPDASLSLSPSSSGSSSSSSSPSLSWETKTHLLVRRTHLHTALAALSHTFLLAPATSPTCMSPTACLARAQATGIVKWALLSTSMSSTGDDGGRTGKGPEPLRPWDRWVRLGVCAQCTAHAQKRHEKGREEVWERMPEWFGLGGWKTLVAAQMRSM